MIMPSGAPDHDAGAGRTSVVLLLKRIPDAFLAGSLAAIIINDLAKKFFGHNLFDTGTTLKNLAAPLIVSALILLVRLLTEIKDAIRPLHRLATDVVEVLPGAGSIPCSDLMRTRAQIDVLTLAGSVVIPLEDEHVIRALLDPRRPSRVRYLMANPFAEPIITRYSHDEPVWKEAGTATIETRLIWLFNLLEGLDSNARERLQVRVYSSYPMLSIFRADDVVYASYYAYKLRGEDTPMVRTDTATYFGKSVMKHFEKLYMESQTLASWLAGNYARLRKDEQCRFAIRYSGVFLETLEGKLVFQRRDLRGRIAHPGKLSVFGGRAEGEELPVVTAARELREETSLVVKPSELLPIATIPYLETDGEERCILGSYFVLRSVDQAKILVKEGAGAETLALEDVVAHDDLTDVPRRLLEARIRQGSWPSA